MEAQLCLQASQADAALKAQQDSSDAQIAGLKVQLAEAHSVKEQQSRCIAGLGAQLAHSQQETSAAQHEASSVNQAFQLLHDAFQEQSALSERHIGQLMAALAAQYAHIQQLQEALDAEGSSSTALLESAPASPEAHDLLSARPPSFHLAPESSTSSFTPSLDMVLSDDEEADEWDINDECDIATSSALFRTPFSDGQDSNTPTALLLDRQASNDDSATTLPSPQHSAVHASGRDSRDAMDLDEPAAEQATPSTPGRSIRSPDRRQLSHKAPAVCARSLRRGAVSRVRVGNSCKVSVKNVKQQRCKSGLRRPSYRK
jgi:hypothetical protein